MVLLVELLEVEDGLFDKGINVLGHSFELFDDLWLPCSEQYVQLLGMDIVDVAALACVFSATDSVSSAVRVDAYVFGIFREAAGALVSSLAPASSSIS